MIPSNPASARVGEWVERLDHKPLFVALAQPRLGTHILKRLGVKPHHLEPTGLA